MRKFTSAICGMLGVYAAWAWTIDPLFVGLYIMLLYDFVERAVKE